MCTSCNKFINDQSLTLDKEVCHENWKCIYRKKYHLTLTNNLDLHNFLIIFESRSLSYWIQHTKLYIWGKSHALIIFWKLPLISAAKQLDYNRLSLSYQHIEKVISIRISASLVVWILRFVYGMMGSLVFLTDVKDIVRRFLLHAIQAIGGVTDTILYPKKKESPSSA